MIYFISDTHFGHEKIIKLCGRPFSGVNEMNEALVSNWNRKVNGGDTVWILGDMFYKTNEPPEIILKKLKGKKRLILGNHDGGWTEGFDLSEYFESVDNMVEISSDGFAAALCHYPLISWDHEEKKYMIHGHIHNNTNLDFWPLLKARERALNASVEVNAYEPVTFAELVKNNMDFKNKH